ncbi:MAG: ROK family protein [Sphingomonadaceae bacterium]|nr:ROK family protein [Sphingomonadaceae bacterium]
MTKPIYGLVEAGGTKFVLGIASGKDDVRETVRIPTTTPDETIRAMVDWFLARGPVAAVGVASFGPIDLDPASTRYGHITETPKPHWSGTDLVGPLKARLKCQVGLDTDVNAAALAEYLWGAAQGHRTSLYFTVGTGVGGGAVIGGKTLRGLSHPEMGHIRVTRHPHDLKFAGTCPFHGDCLEGLASGPAVIARWGKSLSDLPADHEAHDIIAHYLAQLVVSMQAVFEPGQISLGGGVMGTAGLIHRVRDMAAGLGAGYFASSAKEVVTLPGLGDRSGLLGALALAMSAGKDS